MKKKDLKVVDINDLQPESPDIDDVEEIIIDAKINIEDIQTGAPSVSVEPKKIISEAKTDYQLKKIDSSIINSPRFKNYKGNGSQQSVVKFMSEKYRFDRKRYNKVRTGVLLGILALGFAHRFWENPFEEMGFLGSLRGIYFLPIAKAYDVFSRFYIFLAAIFMYLFPLKQNTDTQVIISYDDIIVPSQVFALSRPVKTRVKWDAIKSVEFKKRYNVPFVQLINIKGELVGEIRLDFDDMDSFYEVLDTYCPPKNPLRNLFTNT